MPESVRYERHGLSFWDHRLEANPLPFFHRHDEVEIDLLHEGYVDYLIGGNRTRVRAGVLTVFWGAVPHKVIDLSLPMLGHVLLVPLPWVLALGLGDAFGRELFGGQMIAPASSDPDEATSDRLAMARWGRMLAAPTPDRDRVVLLEVEARLRRLAMEGAGSPQGRPQPAPSSAKVERMIRLVNERYREPLTVVDVARSVDLHPKYATTLFRDACGMPIKQYIAQVRVTHAQRLLATEDVKMLAVARTSGFRAVSQFYETFAAITGMAPSAYRARVRAADPQASRVRG